MRVKVFPPRGCDRSALDARGWCELPTGTVVRDVLQLIGCGTLRARLMLVSVNGVRTSPDAPLKDGDVVGFFSLISGG